MSPQQAKEVLQLYRPDVAADARVPEVAEALALVREDAELAAWFREHCAFQGMVRARVREVAPPARLKAALLAQAKVVQPRPWWKAPYAWQAAAAAVVIFAVIAGYGLRGDAPNRFSNFQSRMVSTALREYRMDVLTPDMRRLREFAAAQGSPADYEIPKGLARLQLTGGGRLSWRSQPVTMVCFDRGDRQMLYLFVLRNAALKDPPASAPQVSKSHDLVTVRWTNGQNTYLLAGPEEADFLKKYL
jgi:uncharacterized membrane protein YbaN (DUF454 family)